MCRTMLENNFAKDTVLRRNLIARERILAREEKALKQLTRHSWRFFFFKERLGLKLTHKRITTKVSKAKSLKSFQTDGYNYEYCKLFVSPDRSPEERLTRQNLVKEMKDKIKNDPGKRYYIRNNRVCAAEILTV